MALRAVFDEREVDPQLGGVCGLYCGACPIYRAWVEQDAERLEVLARAYGVSIERLMCTGCRTPGTFCFGGECEIKGCAQAKGVAFCADCDEFPCDRLQRVAAGSAFRTTLFENVTRIREKGWYAWLREQDGRWRCLVCRAKLAYDERTCHACGRAMSPH